jgi:small subunit ribosomal protein S16
MSVKIRLQRHGRKQAPFYHIVIADSRAPRDGRFIEKIGTYNPMTSPATITIDRDKAYDWLTKGAQPSDTVRAILRFKGVMFRKHLMRGVAKGALTQEQAMEQYNAWITSKESNISERVIKTLAEKESTRVKVFGVAKAKPVVVVEAPTAVEEVVAEAPAAVEVAEEVVAEAPVAEAVVEAPAAVEVVEEVVAEAPVAEVVVETPTVETPAVENVGDQDPELLALENLDTDESKTAE